MATDSVVVPSKRQSLLNEMGYGVIQKFTVVLILLSSKPWKLREICDVHCTRQQNIRQIATVRLNVHKIPIICRVEILRVTVIQGSMCYCK